MRARLCALVLVSLIAACSTKKKSPAAPSTETTAPTAAAPAPVAASAPAATRTLIVAGKKGIREVSLDGKTVRVLARVAAGHPRLYGDRQVIYLAVDKQDVNTLLAVKSLDLATGKTRLVATLPPAVCGGEGSADGGDGEPRTTLALQTDGDFVVDAKRQIACLEVSDRNANMASVVMMARIDLRKGKVERRLTIVAEGFVCAMPGVDVNHERYECNDSPVGIDPTAEKVKSFPVAALRDGSAEDALVVAGGAVKLTLAGFTPGALSPSARWQVLLGNYDEGDYIHFDAFLLDRKNGAIHPLREGAWPTPFTGKQLERPKKLKTTNAVGETTLRWLDVGVDALLVDETIFIPEARSLAIGGDVAR